MRSAILSPLIFHLISPACLCLSLVVLYRLLEICARFGFGRVIMLQGALEDWKTEEASIFGCNANLGLRTSSTPPLSLSLSVFPASCQPLGSVFVNI